MQNLRKLPVGIQSFENIRTDGYIYVDKTEYIYNLANTGKTYFLSRPRRFGKSLLISTMKAYFEGKRELFEGLKIAELEKDWTKHPVLHFDFAGKDFSRPTALEESLNDHFEEWESIYGGKPDRAFDERFKHIIRNAAERTGQRVVVLVDEYDKSLLETEGEVLEKSRRLYKGVFGNLKSLDDLIKFSFITGITKFTRTSIFSDLNQLRDISLTERYAEICGITQEELESNFAPEIDAFAEKNNLSFEECFSKLKGMYDGYKFHQNGKQVYNPFSLLNAFSDGEFKSYWFGTATPSMLIRSLEKNNFNPREFDDGELAVSARRISDYRVDGSDPVPLFYQSGYLTIKGFDSELDEYTLGYPNDEVKFAFLEQIVPMMTGGMVQNYDALEIGAFKKEIDAGNVDGFMTRLKALFAKMPYLTARKDRKTFVVEQNFQNVIYLVFTLLGRFVEVEVPSAQGRADCIVKTKNFIYIFEFKLDESVDTALRQIDAKGYAEPFASDTRKLFKVGVNFSRKERNIDGWKII